jgi:chromosome segregation protein
LEASLAGLADQQGQIQRQVGVAEELKQKEAGAALAQERIWMGVSRQMEQLQGRHHTLEMEQQQLNFQRDQIRGRLSQVYQVSLDEVSGIRDQVSGEEVDADRLKGQIEELAQKLQRMGPVNLSSIDEERELQNRYEYLVNQQNDLTQAREDIHAAISRINRTTRSMFRETFEAIQKEFQVTFRQLFGGGEARLILLDEEDLLESGIEIIAQPPGKPLQAISLLSGGEKALTTIALLFAIFRIKPSPFCLLDEIDAPLDEANIGRFTNALKEFLKDSQFIIITHNKKTIHMADVMYGVTMEESGVSKIVSVKFKSNGSGTGAVTASSPTPSHLQPAE